MTTKIRSRYFIATGGIGGLFGFALMEALGTPGRTGGTAAGTILQMALYFGGFGLAVGTLLGMTEGLVRRRPGRLLYGLLLGALLGGVGGAVGGALGQSLFGLLPVRYASRSNADLAIVLDSSGSMRQFLFWGNDPWGKRKDAAQELIAKLAPTDRVAVIDFDHQATLLFPLSYLDSDQKRDAARRAVDRVDNVGGTDLTAGLAAAIEVLGATPSLPTESGEPRARSVIFLTDGVGAFDPNVVAWAREQSIVLYAIGLGSGVDARLLEDAIARPTGGEYFAVRRAADLVAVFDQIYTERIAMTSRPAGAPEPGAELTTSALALALFRIASWSLMGLMIGLGQGVRENTREDLMACGLGGFVGGLLGGGVFEPLSTLLSLDTGAWSRMLADFIVGACIGGSMRLVQERFVDALPRTTRLARILPEKETPGAPRRLPRSPGRPAQYY